MFKICLETLNYLLKIIYFTIYTYVSFTYKLFIIFFINIEKTLYSIYLKFFALNVIRISVLAL